jgi:hypothetical protein
VIGDLAAISRHDLASAWRLLRGLPALLRHPLTVEEAGATLRAHLAQREARFLSLVQRTVYANPASPYRALFRAAGCEAGDLAALVQREGLDAALRRLYRAGVYLTVDELKGRVPAVRGSTAVEVTPAQLTNPLISTDLALHTGGTRGPETMVPISLDSIRESARNQCLFLHARGGLGWTHAVYGIPGWAASRVVLRHAAFGATPAHWFSQVDPSARGLHPRYRWSARIMGWGGRLAGVSLPWPRHVPPENPRRIVDWMAGVLRRGGTPHLRTFASAAVTICRTAGEAGVDLAGAQFTLGSEPCTPRRRAAVEAVGAHPVPSYATLEAGGPIGDGCLHPTEPDEVHLYADTHAVIQPVTSGGPGELPGRALLLTVLFPSSPFVLINASLGDQADVVDRPCGCAMERLGWTTRLHTIRSFEKLTAGGMTFLDGSIIRVLEDVLPARFGGGPNDYQLVEREDEHGASRLDLVVDPALGPLDEAAILRAFFEAIGPGAGVERVMTLDWQAAGLVHVRRRAPLATRSGKIFHLHSTRAQGAPE